MSQLFDKQGAADPDLAALEERLASARHRPPAVSFEKQAARRRARWPIAAVAAAAVAAFAWVQLRAPRWIDTSERTTVAVGDIGQVTIEPGARARFVDRHRIELERGDLYAKVNAPPRLFVVDTPAARAVDLGCEYRLFVDASGMTRLIVLTGEVSLESGGVAARVPAGAATLSAKGMIPRVPRSVNAAPLFQARLEEWEFRGGSLDELLAVSERRDAVSLWNMLPRVSGDARLAVAKRLDALVPRPAQISQDAVLKLDAAALEAWWGATL